MADKLPFDALVFDLGGVIVAHDNERLFRRLAEGCKAGDALDPIRQMASDRRIGTGELSAEDLHEILVAELGYRLGLADFLADWCSHFTLDPAMLDLVQHLADGHRLLLFSNTNRAHWDYLVRLTGGALAGFDAYLSYELGAVKPSLDAFRLVASRAAIDPARSLFVDDLPENVEAARRVGFHGHRFESRPALERFFSTAASRPEIEGRR